MLLNKTITVWSTFSVIGFHNWPEAPDNVSYLRDVHRHQFKFTVGLEVEALNRSQEFHTLEAKSMELLCLIFTQKEGVVESSQTLDFKNNSCEMIADMLLTMLYEVYHVPIIVEVSEDGEHGAIVKLF